MTPEIRSAPDHRLDVLCRRFSRVFDGTLRGARLARLLTVRQLADWGWDGEDESAYAAALVVGEFAANAVAHGRVPGRGFLLTLHLHLAQPAVRMALLRIEVADCRAGRPSVPVPSPSPGDGGEHGRGLLIVDALVE
ncbi:ATP-binding protein [Streptomyces minutiscleroticus]|nr:ATP-binding protein [Streptomyces minutiscleroticus]